MIVELAWDSKLFKRKIGRLTRVPAEKRLKRLISQAYKEGFAYITCRTRADKMSELQLLEAHGFYTADIGTVWELKTGGISLPAVSSAVRVATTNDASALKTMACGLFLDGRFYHDPFFAYEEAEKVYHSWIETALRDKAQKTFILEGCGFITCKKISNNRGDISLIGVVPKKQRKGTGHILMRRAFDWFEKTGTAVVTVRTQTMNIRAMNFYSKVGFRIVSTDVTMGLILAGRMRRAEAVG